MSQGFRHSRTAVALLLAVGTTIAHAADSPSLDAPNIVFILADDLGYGDVGCFNAASKIATPNIDRLAREGMRFTDAHAPASICVPSRYGLLTGRYPFRTWSSRGKQARERGGHAAAHYPAPMLIHEPGRLNLAALLKKHGYATACFGKWHQGMNLKADAAGVLATTPADLGFDYYFGYDAPEQPPYGFIENKRFVSPLTKTIPAQLGDEVTNPETQGAHWAAGAAAADWDFGQCLPRIAAKVDAWIARRAATAPTAPFFIYYAIPAPHAPWMPGDTFRGRSGAGRYGDYVMDVDAQVGQVLETLRKQGHAERTLVFFSSDNGPVWYEPDIVRYGHHAAGPWRGMKGDLHEGGHRMPFVARWPGKIPAGTTCDQLISFTDMLATFAALLGDTLPAAAGEDSFDISPLLFGRTPQTPVRVGLVHPNWGSSTLAIREGDWKLILPQWVYTVEDRTITPDRVVAAPGNRPRETFELYNLKDDPAETKNLAATQPERVAAIFESLKKTIARGGSR